jgi:hypothetical protein
MEERDSGVSEIPASIAGAAAYENDLQGDGGKDIEGSERDAEP